MNFVARIFFSVGVCGLLFLATIPDGEARSEKKRRVTIPWRAVPKAVVYEFQLARSPEMDPLIFKKKYRRTQTVLKLRPGTYYFRVRGFDQSKNPGPWTQVEAFAVNPEAPKLLRPEKNKRFSELLQREEGIEFEWEEGLSGSEYFFEILDKRGSLLNRRVNDPYFEWIPERPGVYQWRIGYQTPSGIEWGEKRAFLIKRSAIPKQLATSEFNLFERGDPGESWLIGKGIQSVVAYTIDDNDTKGGTTRAVNASAASLVGGLGLEFRRQLPRKSAKRWGFSWSVGVNVFRQVILERQFFLPRFQVMGMWSRNTRNWSLGPAVQLGMNRIAIFVPVEGRTKKEGKANRFSLGAGYQGRYQVGPNFWMRGFIMPKLELGGGQADNSLPSSLGLNLGVQGGFGAGFLLGSKKEHLLDLMLRVVSETYGWPGVSGDPDSSISNTFVVLDAGIGFKL